MQDSCSRWIAVCVDTFDHHVFKGEEFSRRDAWLWLIANAAWKDHKARMGNAMVPIRRGQVVVGLSYLAEKWGWGIKKVRLFLDLLESEGMLEKGNSKGRLANVATICNYEKYQTAGAGCGQVEGQVQGRFRAGSGQDSTRDTKDTNKDSLSEVASDETNVHEQPKAAKARKPYPDDFEAFWLAYPDRTNNSKANALKQWMRLQPQDRALAVEGLPKLAAHCRANPDYRCLHAERYISGRRWEALLEPQAAISTSGGPWWRDPTKLAQMTPERWRAGISKFANGVWPVAELGPPPRKPDCLVPQEIIAELRLIERYDEAGLSTDPNDQH